MLSSLTISEAHKKMKAKEISAEELMRSCLERIDAVDTKINAVIWHDAERALQEAKKIDQKKSFDDPLAGIPFLTKDVYCEVGIPTTACSNILRNKNYVPPFESTTTKRLKARGALSIGKVNTDEFTMGGSTETSCYGVTKNPWDQTRVAGGSSGGSAAAVSADECIFSLGTDTGGSIRQPASFCSCAGLRVTYGRTSRFGAMSMASSLDTTGPLAKTVEDLAIILQAIAGKDPLDATTGDAPVPDYQAGLTKLLKGLRIGLPKEYFLPGMNKEVEAAIRESAKVFQSLGATIVDVSLPMTKYAVATYYVLCPSEVSSNMARYDGIRFGHTVEKPENLIDYYERVRSEGFGAEVKRRIMVGTFALSAGYFDAYYRKAQQVRTLICKDFNDAFTKVDLILSPVAPNPALKIGEHAGDPVAMYLEDVFTIPQAMAGIPALSLPCGFSKDNLPIGLQLAGPQWSEELLLRAGYAFERETEWHTKKPAL
jgi:aspartyl-tRNA(Asn)/glutamyl-tRNA(Gln) amidotransferase subunit A